MIPLTEPYFNEQEVKNVVSCIRSGWISSLGRYVSCFEKKFARFCETKYGISVSSGTAALHLALAGLGIGRGDEVILPTLSFVATANAVVYTGARPVFVDSEPRTWNIAPDKIKAKITHRTKAIIAVHLYGHPADMDPILRLARKHNLRVIEDVCEAHGAVYRGKKLGSLGDAGCFSFYGNKIITTGEGGMVTTNNRKLAKRIAMLHDHAMSPVRRYWHPEIGFNYRMTNLQAAVGAAQLKKINQIIKIKRRNARLYSSLLKGVKEISLPLEEDWAINVFWMYTVLVGDNFGPSRDDLINRLKKNGIDSRPLFIPIHLMPPYRIKARFPVAEQLSRRGISLPSGVTLKKEEIKKVCKVISDAGQ